MNRSRAFFRRPFALFALAAVSIAAGTLSAAWLQEYKSGILWPEPKAEGRE